MRIDIHLSTDSISAAIRQLRQAEENLRWGLNETIEILVKNGEGIANSKYDGMAGAVGYMEDETVGIIATNGEANIIAEFGAGDTVINPSALFENAPDTEVFPGSYSLLEGSKEYATYGYWHFGGKKYTQVEPRMGLFYAKQAIIQTAGEVAQEVIKL